MECEINEWMNKWVNEFVVHWIWIAERKKMSNKKGLNEELLITQGWFDSVMRMESVRVQICKWTQLSSPKKKKKKEINGEKRKKKKKRNEKEKK